MTFEELDEITGDPKTPPIDYGPNHHALNDPMMDKDFAETTQLVLATRQANAQLIHELSQMGFHPEFTVSMLAIYFQGLVDVGILTKAQLVTIEKNWEQGFNRQLQMMLKSGQAALEQAQLRSNLLVPSNPVQHTGPNRAQRRGAAKQGLIIPGPGGQQ